VFNLNEKHETKQKQMNEVRAVGLFLLLQLNSCFTSCFRSITIQLKQMEKRNRSFFTTQLGEDKKGKWWIVFFSFNYKRNERREKSAWIKWKEHTIHHSFLRCVLLFPSLFRLIQFTLTFHSIVTELNQTRRGTKNTWWRAKDKGEMNKGKGKRTHALFIFLWSFLSSSLDI